MTHKIIAILLAFGLVAAILPLGWLTSSLADAASEEPTINYATLTTDQEKLFACYSLIEQARLEHNRQAAIATADPKAYLISGKFRTYAQLSKDAMKALLAERNRLKENILRWNYSLSEWNEIGQLTEAEQDTILLQLFGDKTAQQVKTTKATSYLLDDLKEIKLDDLIGQSGFDPTEDFTTYDETDDSGNVTRTTNNVTYTRIDSTNQKYHVSDLKGTDYFDGDFEHLLMVRETLHHQDALTIHWMLADAQDDAKVILDANGSYFMLRWRNPIGTHKYQLFEIDSGTPYNDEWAGPSLGPTYYIEVERDEGVGTYGTLYAYICTDDYWDDGGHQEASLSVLLHSSTKDFDYVYGLNAWDDDIPGTSASGWVSLLDLQEVGLPSVTTSAATSVEDTSATLNGEVTLINDTSIDERGFCWGTSSQSAPNSTTAPSGSAYDDYWTETGSFGATTFNKAVANFTTATTYYYRAAAENDVPLWGYGDEVSFLTKPAAPTNVAATDGTHTDKVVVTWTKSSGNVTGYKIYRDAGLIDTVGDVATYDDTGADAPTITPGTASATDAVFTDKVVLSLSGESGNNGTTHTYKVRAYNDSGDSADSATDTGYRGTTSLTYQWYRSSGDADSDYSQLAGATTDPYDDTTAPQGTITPGSGGATDGNSPLHTTLSVSGESTSPGEGRYYKCEVTMSGASSQNSTSDRGTRGVGAISYQWYRSSGVGCSGFSQIGGATTDPYDDTASPAPTIDGGNATASDGTSPDYVTLSCNETAGNGATRCFLCELSAAGAASQNTTTDTGYRGTTTLTYQWWRSSGDAPTGYSTIPGGTTDPYNDTGGVEDPDGRYYLVTTSMTGAVSQNSTADRGYEQAADEPTVVTLNATSVVCTTASLRGNITDVTGGNATIRGFQYGLSTGNYTWATNETGNYGTGVYSLGVSSLSQNTTYYYRAYAINGEGTGYGNETSFVTLEASLPTVTNSAATEVTSSRATLPGTITDTGCAGVTVSVRGFEWGTSTGNYSSNWTQTGSYGTGAYSRAISGLSANTTYYWRALATNVVGTNYSAERSFSTTAAAEPSLSLDVSALIDYLSDFLEGPMGINSIVFILGLIGFAIWKKGWIRIVLALSVVIWGVFAMDYDIKIAIPLLAIGSVLFFMGILKMIQQRRAEMAEAEG